MYKPQFRIRTLLGTMALTGFLLTIVTQTHGWIIAILTTVLLANVAAAVFAFVVLVLLPMLQRKAPSNQPAKLD